MVNIPENTALLLAEDLDSSDCTLESRMPAFRKCHREYILAVAVGNSGEHHFVQERSHSPL